MNLQQLEALSDDQLRIKVAEALGITDIHPLSRSEYYKLGDDFDGWLGSPVGYDKSGELVKIRDYPHDLNACHEMECTLNFERLKLYSKHLPRLSEQEEGTGLLGVWHATARQRCIAFLMTIGEKK